MSLPLTSKDPPLLEMRGIHKRFPGAHVLKGIDFSVHRGEVHALLGENGAGKSTLMHILAGVYQPDAGTISFNNLDGIVIDDEQKAQSLGIAIVYQERSLFGLLSVAENIYVKRQPTNRWGIIDRRKLRAQAGQTLAQLELDIDPTMPLNRLSSVQQQMVEVAKALSLNAKLLIFDEPTAALTETETVVLFQVINQLKMQGAGGVYISHRLDEIFEIADRVTVLRDGELQGTVHVSETTPDDLVSRIVGREMSANTITEHNQAIKSADVRLEVRHLSSRRLTRDRRTVLEDISFSARAGEIIALAGLTGSGRTELALAIFGASERERGEIFVCGKRVNIRSPQDAIRVGLGYLPEDRKEAGLFLEMSIADNIAAARLDHFGSWWIDDTHLDTVADDYCQKLRIAVPNVKRAVQNLSGGTQQKVVLAKWLLSNPKILIVDEPTRGIDVGAKAEVHNLLRRLVRQDTAIILISSDLPEVLALADRILVMREGRISGELSGREATAEKIMRYASIAS